MTAEDRVRRCAGKVCVCVCDGVTTVVVVRVCVCVRVCVDAERGEPKTGRILLQVSFLYPSSSRSDTPSPPQMKQTDLASNLPNPFAKCLFARLPKQYR